MKKISNLKGIKVLSRNEQKEVNGSGWNRPYCRGNNQCCITTQNGLEICDYGYCLGNGFCMWA